MGKQVVKRLLARDINPLDSRVLVMGLTFKENVADIRNTKVIDVIRELESFNVKVDIVDPFASPRRWSTNTALTLKEGGRRRVRRCHGREPRRIRGLWAKRMGSQGWRLMRDDNGVSAGRPTLDYWSLPNLHPRILEPLSICAHSTRILVTGGAGFIGSHVIRTVLTNPQRCAVVNLDALTYAGNLANLSDLDTNPRYAFVKGDIQDAL